MAASTAVVVAVVAAAVVAVFAESPSCYHFRLWIWRGFELKNREQFEQIPNRGPWLRGGSTERRRLDLKFAKKKIRHGL